MPKVKLLQGVRMDPICPNLPIRSKKNLNKKSWYIPHLKDNLILIIFLLKNLGGMGPTFAVMCRQSYRWRHIKRNYIFPVKTLEFFAWIVPVKLNYQSVVDRGGVRPNPSCNWLPMKYQKQLQDLFCERDVRKTFYKY